MFRFENPEMTDLAQWSLDVTLIFEPEYIGKEVHFSNSDEEHAITYVIDEEGMVDIPNILLQEAKPITVWVYVLDCYGGYSKRRKVIRVLKKAKPDWYAMEEEEVRLWRQFQEAFSMTVEDMLEALVEGDIIDPASSTGNDLFVNGEGSIFVL